MQPSSSQFEKGLRITDNVRSFIRTGPGLCAEQSTISQPLGRERRALAAGGGAQKGLRHPERLRGPGGLAFTWRGPATPFRPGSLPWPRGRGHLRPLLLHPPRHRRRRQTRSSGGRGATTATGWNRCSSAAGMASAPPPPPAPARGRPPRARSPSPRKAATGRSAQPGTRRQKGAGQPPTAPPPTSGPPRSNRRSGGGDVLSQQAPRAPSLANQSGDRPALPRRRVDSAPALFRPRGERPSARACVRPPSGPGASRPAGPVNALPLAAGSRPHGYVEGLPLVCCAVAVHFLQETGCC